MTTALTIVDFALALELQLGRDGIDILERQFHACALASQRAREAVAAADVAGPTRLAASTASSRARSAAPLRPASSTGGRHKLSAGSAASVTAHQLSLSRYEFADVLLRSLSMAAQPTSGSACGFPFSRTVIHSAESTPTAADDGNGDGSSMGAGMESVVDLHSQQAHVQQGGEGAPNVAANSLNGTESALDLRETNLCEVAGSCSSVPPSVFSLGDGEALMQRPTRPSSAVSSTRSVLRLAAASPKGVAGMQPKADHVEKAIQSVVARIPKGTPEAGGLRPYTQRQAQVSASSRSESVVVAALWCEITRRRDDSTRKELEALLTDVRAAAAAASNGLPGALHAANAAIARRLRDEGTKQAGGVALAGFAEKQRRAWHGVLSHRVMEQLRSWTAVALPDQAPPASIVVCAGAFDADAFLADTAASQSAHAVPKFDSLEKMGGGSNFLGCALDWLVGAIGVTAEDVARAAAHCAMLPPPSPEVVLAATVQSLFTTRNGAWRGLRIMTLALFDRIDRHDTGEIFWSDVADFFRRCRTARRRDVLQSSVPAAASRWAQRRVAYAFKAAPVVAFSEDSAWVSVSGRRVLEEFNVPTEVDEQLRLLFPLPGRRLDMQTKKPSGITALTPSIRTAPTTTPITVSLAPTIKPATPVGWYEALWSVDSAATRADPTAGPTGRDDGLASLHRVLTLYPATDDLDSDSLLDVTALFENVPMGAPACDWSNASGEKESRMVKSSTASTFQQVCRFSIDSRVQFTQFVPDVRDSQIVKHFVARLDAARAAATESRLGVDQRGLGAARMLTIESARAVRWSCVATMPATIAAVPAVALSRSAASFCGEVSDSAVIVADDVNGYISIADGPNLELRRRLGHARGCPMSQHNSLKADGDAALKNTATNHGASTERQVSVLAMTYVTPWNAVVVATSDARVSVFPCSPGDITSPPVENASSRMAVRLLTLVFIPMRADYRLGYILGGCASGGLYMCPVTPCTTARLSQPPRLELIRCGSTGTAPVTCIAPVDHMGGAPSAASELVKPEDGAPSRLNSNGSGRGSATSDGSGTAAFRTPTAVAVGCRDGSLRLFEVGTWAEFAPPTTNGRTVRRNMNLLVAALHIDNSPTRKATTVASLASSIQTPWATMPSGEPIHALAYSAELDALLVGCGNAPLLFFGPLVAVGESHGSNHPAATVSVDRYLMSAPPLALVDGLSTHMGRITCVAFIPTAAVEVETGSRTSPSARGSAARDDVGEIADRYDGPTTAAHGDSIRAVVARFLARRRHYGVIGAALTADDAGLCRVWDLRTLSCIQQLELGAGHGSVAYRLLRSPTVIVRRSYFESILSALQRGRRKGYRVDDESGDPDDGGLMKWTAAYARLPLDALPEVGGALRDALIAAATHESLNGAVFSAPETAIAEYPPAYCFSVLNAIATSVSPLGFLPRHLRRRRLQYCAVDGSAIAVAAVGATAFCRLVIDDPETERAAAAEAHLFSSTITASTSAANQAAEVDDVTSHAPPTAEQSPARLRLKSLTRERNSVTSITPNPTSSMSDELQNAAVNAKMRLNAAMSDVLRLRMRRRLHPVATAVWIQPGQTPRDLAPSTTASSTHLVVSCDGLLMCYTTGSGTTSTACRSFVLVSHTGHALHVAGMHAGPADCPSGWAAFISTCDGGLGLFDVGTALGAAATSTLEEIGPFHWVASGSERSAASLGVRRMLYMELEAHARGTCLASEVSQPAPGITPDEADAILASRTITRCIGHMHAAVAVMRPAAAVVGTARPFGDGRPFVAIALPTRALFIDDPATDMLTPSATLAQNPETGISASSSSQWHRLTCIAGDVTPTCAALWSLDNHPAPGQAAAASASAAAPLAASLALPGGADVIDRICGALEMSELRDVMRRLVDLHQAAVAATRLEKAFMVVVGTDTGEVVAARVDVLGYNLRVESLAPMVIPPALIAALQKHVAVAEQVSRSCDGVSGSPPDAQARTRRRALGAAASALLRLIRSHYRFVTPPGAVIGCTTRVPSPRASGGATDFAPAPHPCSSGRWEFDRTTQRRMWFADGGVLHSVHAPAPRATPITSMTALPELPAIAAATDADGCLHLLHCPLWLEATRNPSLALAPVPPAVRAVGTEVIAAAVTCVASVFVHSSALGAARPFIILRSAAEALDEASSLAPCLVVPTSVALVTFALAPFLRSAFPSGWWGRNAVGRDGGPMQLLVPSVFGGRTDVEWWALAPPGATEQTMETVFNRRDETLDARAVGIADRMTRVRPVAPALLGITTLVAATAADSLGTRRHSAPARVTSTQQAIAVAAMSYDPSHRILVGNTPRGNHSMPPEIFWARDPAASGGTLSVTAHCTAPEVVLAAEGRHERTGSPRWERNGGQRIWISEGAAVEQGLGPTPLHAAARDGPAATHLQCATAWVAHRSISGNAPQHAEMPATPTSLVAPELPATKVPRPVSAVAGCTLSQRHVLALEYDLQAIRAASAVTLPEPPEPNTPKRTANATPQNSTDVAEIAIEAPMSPIQIPVLSASVAATPERLPEYNGASDAERSPSWNVRARTQPLSPSALESVAAQIRSLKDRTHRR